MNAINQLVLNTMAVTTLSEAMIIGLTVFVLTCLYQQVLVEEVDYNKWKVEERRLRLMEQQVITISNQYAA